MRLLGFILLTISLAACNQSTTTQVSSPLEGAWLLIGSTAPVYDFMTNNNQDPLGFRFYSRDSTEVYRNNYFVRRGRFVPYKFDADVLEIFQSDSLGWWKGKVKLTGDILVVFHEKDTLMYERLFRNTAFSPPPFEKIILSGGSSWGFFYSAVLYPDDKAVIYTKGENRVIAYQFCIRHAPGLFKQMTQSSHWINEIMKHERYDSFLTAFDNAVVMDGGFSEELYLSKDTAWMTEASSMYSYQNHLLGLQGYAFSRILGDDFFRKPYYRFRVPVQCDSVRKSLLPVCGLEGILNHLSISMLIAESLNSMHFINDRDYGELNFNYNPRWVDSVRFSTNGRIVEFRYKKYDVGYDFIELLRKHN